MVATVVATPVLERLAVGSVAGVVRGATERAAYLDLDGFVVALTAPGVPLMPNGIAVDRTALGDGAVRAAPGRIALAGDVVTWDAGAPPAWEPRLPRFGPADANALRERGAAIAAALGPWELDAAERGREGLDALGAALRDRDADAAARAAERLLGLGGGLTPEGDDVLAATAAVVAAAGAAFGFAGAERERWLAALVPVDVPVRTTALSATLLRLGAEGRIVEPVHRLLDVGARDAAWREALATLEGTGASTGRAYAAAVAGSIEALGS
jgi:Protein of unknown function (DUF2877)